MGFHEELEGLCHFPLPNKKPCRKPVPLLDSNGVQMMFCSEHMREAREWIKRKKAGANGGKKGQMVIRGGIREKGLPVPI